VKSVYSSVVAYEAKYKEVKDVPESVLYDTIQTAFDICTYDVRREKLSPAYEGYISGGIRKMSSDLISGKRFSIPEAKLAASKAAYLAACLLTELDTLQKYKYTDDLRDMLKPHHFKGR